MDSKLKKLVQECHEFRAKTFKKNEGDISNAFRIPYTGFENPDYVTFEDYIQDDVCSLILECISYGDDVKTIDDLIEEWKSYDDNLRDYVEESLLWQHGLKDAEIILSNCEYEETDSTLWEGLDPEEMIDTKAFWTYKREVYNRVVKKINECKK